MNCSRLFYKECELPVAGSGYLYKAYDVDGEIVFELWKIIRETVQGWWVTPVGERDSAREMWTSGKFASFYPEDARTLAVSLR